MSDIGAPAKRGEDSPVPTDIQTRKFSRPEKDEPNDNLIPKSFIEQRAEERQGRTLSYADLYAVASGDRMAESVSNPLHGQPAPAHPAAQPVQNPAAAPVGMQYPGMPAQGMVQPGMMQPGMAAPHPPAGYVMPVQYANFAPGGQIMSYGQPMPAYPAAYPYGYAPLPRAPFIPPQEPWKPGQRAASLWGSFLQHTIFAIAAQIFVYGALFLLFAGTSWDGQDDIFQNGMPSTLTDFLVWLAKPENLLLSYVLLFIVVAALCVVAYYSGALWQRAKGLRGRAKAFWLTALSGGGITILVFITTSPVTFFVWLFGSVLLGPGGNAGMWGMTFTLILIGGLINGFICMGFGRIFLSKERPRIDFARLAAEAEARARAEDERALAGDSKDKYRIDGT